MKIHHWQKFYCFITMSFSENFDPPPKFTGEAILHKNLTVVTKHVPLNYLIFIKTNIPLINCENELKLI